MAASVEDTLPQEIAPSVSGDAVMDESEEAKAERAVKQGLSPPVLFPTGDPLIRPAVEFYFADSNLPFDKYEASPLYPPFFQLSFRFMWGLHSANDDHWVPLATVTSFKRMKEFQMFGQDWIISAMRKLSTLLEVDASGVNVRRTTQVQEPKGQNERSVYAVGASAITSPPCPRTCAMLRANLIYSFRKVLVRRYPGSSKSSKLSSQSSGT